MITKKQEFIINIIFFILSVLFILYNIVIQFKLIEVIFWICTGIYCSSRILKRVYGDKNV